MKTRAKVTLIALSVGVPAFFLGFVLSPSPSGAQTPSAAQMAFLSLLGAAEALALGLGVAFVFLGWKHILSKSGPPGSQRTWALATCLSITWLLVSLWPYEVLHRYVGETGQGRLYLEYGFHVTLVVCGAVLAYALLRRDPLLGEARRMTRIV